jgi:hypothetical protein
MAKTVVKDHKPHRPILYRGRADRRDYARLRSQQHKAVAASGVEVIYFDRPGDSVEGYLSGPYRQPGPTASHYRLEREGYVVEIKSHMLLGEIIRCRGLVGEYVRVVYRGRTPRIPGDRHGNTCKSYYLYAIPTEPTLTEGGNVEAEHIEPEEGFEGTSHTKRHLSLVPWNYPRIAPEETPKPKPELQEASV